jgi:hypothetical protein
MKKNEEIEMEFLKKLNKIRGTMSDSDLLNNLSAIQEMNWDSDYSILNNISHSRLEKILNGEYEIAGSKFKRDDWVTVEWSDFEHTTHKVNSCVNELVSINLAYHSGVSNHLPPADIVRYATSEEIKQEKSRAFWYQIGRKPYEYKVGDIVKYKGYIRIVKEVKTGGHGNTDLILSESNEKHNFSYHIENVYSDDLKIVSTAERRLDWEEK